MVDVCWKTSLKNALKSPEALLDYVHLSHIKSNLSQSAQKIMPIRVPISFASRIEKGNPFDPILLQVLPTISEDIISNDHCHDPLQENVQIPYQGIIHKYKSRALLIANSACAVHCRYCFRREFDYSEHIPNKKDWLNAFQYIQEDKNINEVILSGGDPLLLSDRQIAFFIQNITDITHVKRLRIHSRIPVVLPERITNTLIKLITSHRLSTILVIHSNHANELSQQVKTILLALRSELTLLNQSVLLKNINDNVASLTELSERLFECGVLPYYLHTLDKVTGTQHFNITDHKAWEIHQELQQNLPGFLVPKLVKEVAFKKYKISISDYLFAPK